MHWLQGLIFKKKASQLRIELRRRLWRRVGVQFFPCRSSPVVDGAMFYDRNQPAGQLIWINLFPILVQRQKRVARQIFRQLSPPHTMKSKAEYGAEMSVVNLLKPVHFVYAWALDPEEPDVTPCDHHDAQAKRDYLEVYATPPTLHRQGRCLATNSVCTRSAAHGL